MLGRVRELPAGTVTFLFTDIEGSTRLLHDLGGDYVSVLDEHRRLLRRAFADHGGVEVDTQGDAFFVAFERATDGVNAALAGQGALASSALSVRMGLHTGEPIVTDEGYVGLDVHRAARIMSAGHGGQILVSERVKSFLGPSVECHDLGLHRLKDLGEPERLHQVGAGSFPPPRTLDATNLPIPATTLLGRQELLGRLVALVAGGERLVTLVGPGGTGKTRLALEAAAELVGRVPDGVFWVPLAGISDAELVLPEIAQALGAREDLEGFLRERRLLILVDNAEHLRDAAPALAGLLAGARGLQLLVTSRASLRISGEHELTVEPLETAAAVELLRERASAVGRDLSADATAEAICRRLDGLPLAIELAAARSKLLGAEALLHRLDRALPLLTGGTRDAPERQRTLRAAVAWSYALLDADAQRSFRSLSVFAGGFSLDAAEAVCGADLDTIGALVDASLVKRAGEDRFLLLETIREFADEQLAESRASVEVLARHTRFFSDLAAEAYAARGQSEAEWAQRLEADHDNLRAALDRESDTLELAGLLGWFWLTHSHLVEGAGRLERALPGARGGVAAARALVAAGALAGQRGRRDQAEELFSRGIAAWRTAADARELATALDTFGWFLFFADENERGLAAFEESLELWRSIDGDRGATRALTGVCQLLVAQGDVDRAETLSRELLERSQQDRDLRSEHFAIHFLADCALISADYEAAERLYRESLRAALPLGDVLETTFEVLGVGMSAAGRGDDVRAARLGGAIEAAWEEREIAVSVPFWDALLARHIGAARERLGARGDAIWAEGRSLSFDEAVELALTES
jgi:predicted ATPase/class 3 adenylate cyclase